ncbi:hypothetical protein BRC90_06285 [Halobacteriales archaeon QS_4_69_34]|jgi:hypothetical protein|nr:MAG: hypothetical protein BRC90_06285 [Halobacteriales archaeon QS_4_69_34]
MYRWTWAHERDWSPADRGSRGSEERLLADGGHEQGDGQNEEETETPIDADGRIDTDERTGAGEGGSGGGRSNVEITEAGEAEPAEPKWDPPDIDDVDDIPEVTGPKTRPAEPDRADAPGGESDGTAGEQAATDATIPDGQAASDPTAGMPNTARSPGGTRLKRGGADGYVVALELCAHLPEEMRLPEEAADLVPVALEAELEGSVQQFAGSQFDNPSPHVETLDFVEADGEVWLRLRLGIPPEAFADLDPDEIGEHALQKLEGMF